MVGDVVGRSGCRAIFVGLGSLIKRTRADVVVVNGENAADGYGLTPDLADQIFSAGADVITSGNHIWQRREIHERLDTDDRLLRPANYPPSAPGHGVAMVPVRDNTVAIVNLQGRVDLSDVDDPFRAGREIAKEVGRRTRAIVIDFHAESLDEKEALAFHLDGRISALVGTHTHVTTADERILPGGTAFQGDLGMSGPVNSSIGMRPDIALERALSQMPIRLEVSDEPAVLHGTRIEIDLESGKTISIERVRQESAV